MSVFSILANSIAALALIAVILSYAIIGAIVNYRKLNKFNGPRLAGFTRGWLFWQSIHARVNTAVFKALEKYGSVCRIGPNLLITNDPDIIRHINAPGSAWRRSDWYDAMKLDPRLDSVFSTRDEKLHTELRAKESGGYNGRDIDTLEPDIDDRVVDLVNLIKTTYNGVSMDFANVARFFTLDVLSTVAFGAPFGFLAANKDLWDYDKMISGYLAILELSSHHKFYRWLISTSFVQALAGPRETDKVGMGPVLAIARKAVAERYGSDPKVKKDMLGYFVKRGLSQLQCEVEANLQIIAGSDSTTTVVRSVMYLLAGTPASYGRLRAEIDDAALDGRISSPVIKYSEAQRLQYLNACIWEGLRMYPPLFGLRGKVAPRAGDTVKGIYFPRGTEVAVCDDGVCRRKDIFGQDSDLFRPERWLEACPETRLKYQRTVDLIFGSGRYLCLGRHIAMIELHKAICELMRNFDWAIANPMKGINTYAHGVHIQSNMNLVARPRHSGD